MVDFIKCRSASREAVPERPAPSGRPDKHCRAQVFSPNFFDLVYSLSGIFSKFLCCRARSVFVTVTNPMMIHDATPAEGCRIRLDSCVSSIERHLSKVLVAFFFPLLENLPPTSWIYRPRIAQGCATPAKKVGDALSTPTVFTARSEVAVIKR